MRRREGRGGRPRYDPGPRALLRRRARRICSCTSPMAPGRMRLPRSRRRSLRRKKRRPSWLSAWSTVTTWQPRATRRSVAARHAPDEDSTGSWSRTFEAEKRRRPCSRPRRRDPVERRRRSGREEAREGAPGAPEAGDGCRGGRCGRLSARTTALPMCRFGWGTEASCRSDGCAGSRSSSASGRRAPSPASSSFASCARRSRAGKRISPTSSASGTEKARRRSRSSEARQLRSPSSPTPALGRRPLRSLRGERWFDRRGRRGRGGGSRFVSRPQPVRTAEARVGYSLAGRPRGPRSEKRRTGIIGDRRPAESVGSR